MSSRGAYWMGRTENVAWVERSETRERSFGSNAAPRISLTLNPGYKHCMSSFLSHGLVPIAIGAVAVVLLLGLVNMMRGGSPNTSQKLMRLRVLLQFVAIVIIMVTIWVMAK
jgi:Hypoxia induced protein conserved region